MTSKIDINVLHVCVERSIFLANLQVGLCLTITLRISLHDLLCGWLAVSDSGCAGDCAIVAVFTGRGGSKVNGCKWDVHVANRDIRCACCNCLHHLGLAKIKGLLYTPNTHKANKKKVISQKTSSQKKWSIKLPRQRKAFNSTALLISPRHRFVGLWESSPQLATDLLFHVLTEGHLAQLTGWPNASPPRQGRGV